MTTSLSNSGFPKKINLALQGDGGNPPVRLDGEWIRNQAQNPRSHLGKILRLNADGTVPRDNPFVDSAEADPAVWSYGHRNIQGVATTPCAPRYGLPSTVPWGAMN